MPIYRVREVKVNEFGNGRNTEKLLREYERQSTDNASMVAEVGHFFEMELSSPKAPQTVDFDAIVVLAEYNLEIARFSVSEFWCREWRATSVTPSDPAGYRPEKHSTRSSTPL